MKLKDVQYGNNQPKKHRLNLKTTAKAIKWIKENGVSPQKVFDNAIEELMTVK